MDRIINRVERDPLYRGYLDAYHAEAEHTASDAITLPPRGPSPARCARQRSSPTRPPGSTALRAARERPDRPILGLITEFGTARRLALAVGPARAWSAEDVKDIAEMVEQHPVRHAVESGIAQTGSEPRDHRRRAVRHPGARPISLRIAWIR